MDARQERDAADIYQQILEKLEALRKTENQERLLTGALLFLLGFIALVFLAVGAEVLLRLGVLARTLLFWGLAVGSCAGFGWFVGVPFLKLLEALPSSDDETLAKKAGHHFPSIKDRLLNLLQLHREKEGTLYSPELIDAAFVDLRNEVADLDFRDAVSFEIPRRVGKSLSLVAAVVLLIAIILPSSIFEAAGRLARFRQEFVVPPSIRFTIEPGNAEVVRGEDVRISIAVDGLPVESVALFMRSEGEVNENEVLLKRNPDGRFSYDLTSVKGSLQYHAEAQRVESDEYRITVVDRPAVKNLRLRLTYPAYTGIPPRELDDNVGDVTALMGTRVGVEIRANKEPTHGQLVFKDGSQLPLKIAGVVATTQLVLSKDRSYHILLVDEKGIRNSDPIEYQMKVIHDEDPTVSIAVPGKDVDLADDMRLPLALKLHDDFGFTSLRLGYRLIHSKYEQPAQNFAFIELPLDQPRSMGAGGAVEMDVAYFWDLRKLTLATEDVVSYFAEVYDNDAVSGPKVGRSQTYTVRVPSLDEIFADVEKAHHETAEDLKAASEEAKDLKKQLDALNQDLKKSREQIDWEKQKKTEELLKKYEQVQKNLEEATQRLDQLVQQMEKNNLITPETMEKYLELQKLFEQINSPELREAMKKLQEALQNLNPDQLREAMQKFTFSEDAFRQSLERTLSILKRIQIEQKLEEALKRTAELQQRQEAMKEESRRTNPEEAAKRQNLAQRQQDARKEFEALQKGLSDLETKMQEFAEEMPLDELRRLMEELAQQKLGQRMDQAVQQLQSGDLQKASQNQQDIASALQELLKQLRQTQQAMLQKQQQQIVRDLKKMLQNLLELSKQQEALKQESQGLETNSQRFRENAQEQMRLMSELMNLIDSMTKLSQRTLVVNREMGKAMGKALSEMDEAMRGMESRNGAATSEHQGGAMGALNEAAMQVLNALQAMMQGGGGGLQTLLQQLQQMIAQQQGINAGTMNLGQLNTLTMEQQAEMARLAAQQAAVQKSLEQLNEEARRSAERERILGDLGKISEEMKEVLRDLEQKNVNPNTIQKQERILSRLLDAQRSMRERDFEKRRRAEPGKDFTRKSPAELDLTTQEGKNRLMQDLLKAMEEGYAKDYQELIRKYFEALQKLEMERQE
jgi:hypothetical protein